MSTNLSNISKLTLTDTFYNWYLKTNQIIDFIGPLNVYDVFAGDGLIATRSGEGPYTIEIAVQTDPVSYAIDTKINTDGTSDIILNIGSLAQASSVEDTSVFAVSANSSGATIFKVPASDMLPENINGNHHFNGNISVNELSVNSGIINLTGNNIGLYGNITNADATWYYSTNINAWISAENLGVDVNKHIVSNNSGNAIFSFFSDPITNYGNIDLRLETEDGADQKYWSIKTNGSNLPYTLSFGHYTNGTVDETPLQLEVNGTNGGNVTRVNGSIEITNILNSEPFTQTPFAGNVQITDSVNGFLNRFTNRVKLDYRGTLSAGNVVRIATDTDGDVYLEKASASNVSTSYSIGVVESVSAGKATVITSGEFTLSAGTYTPGAIHYLQNTAGLVGTSIGAVTKPVLIATGNNSGIIIPDFSGGAGSGLNNAFTAISIQGEGTYSASGSTTLTLKQGAGINLTLNTNNQLEIAATTGLPTASTYSVYNTNASATTPTTTGISAFSILGRPLSGNLSSITVNPGSILGRRDDTNDNDNPVESISFTQLRSYMGFSSSAYFDTFNFKDSAGTTVKTFSSSTNQTVNIQAGANISFTQSGNTVYIAASGDFTNGTGDGTGSTPLSISAGSSTFTNVTSIDFSDSEDEGTASYKQYIKFKPTAGLPSGSTRIYATPGSDFMLFKSGSTTSNFKEINQTTLELAGSSDTGVATSLTDTSNGPKFNISLSSTISVDKIKPFTANNIIVSGTTAGRETINIFDTTRSSGNDSEIFINAYDTDIDGTGTVRTSVGSPSHCVSIYADSNDTAGNTYPFRFHKLIVKEIDVEDLTVANSVKENLNIRFVSSDTAWSGTYKYSQLSSETIGYGVFRNGDEDPLTTGSKGFGIQFVDGYQSDATGNNTASIFHPYLAAPSPISTFNNTLYRKSLIISDKISFANLNGPGSITPTPTIGWNNLDGGIFVKSTGQKSFIKFENDDTTDDFGNVGVRDQYSFLTYGDNVVFRLNSSPVLYGVNSFILTSSTTEGTTEPSSGLKFEVETYNSSSDGKVAVIDEVTGGLAKVRFKSIVKPFTSAIATDPIGTLYYTLT